MGAKEIMRLVIILTCLAALLLASAGCKKNRETRIRGKVVTFREDSLLWNGDVEVSLYSLGSRPFFDPPMERKHIGPPYSFSFVIKGLDDADEWFDFWRGFRVAVEAPVPGHAAAVKPISAEESQGTDAWRVILLLPRTCVAFHLISESVSDGINIRAGDPPYGPGLFPVGFGFYHASPSNDTVYRCFYWNGETPIRYVTYSDGVETTHYDTLYTSPFDTTYHKIVY